MCQCANVPIVDLRGNELCGMCQLANVLMCQLSNFGETILTNKNVLYLYNGIPIA